MPLPQGWDEIMTEQTVTSEPPTFPRDPARVIEPAGVFDVAAGERLRGALAGTPKGADVRIDFLAVREFHDTALGVLARAVSEAKEHHLTITGLGHHQRSILRYLGVDGRTFDDGDRTAGQA